MMDLEKLIEAVKLCGSTPKVDQCKQCAYWAGGDMSRCIPNMTGDAATALSALQAENEKLRAELEQARTDCAVAEKNHADCIDELERVKRERDAVLNAFRGFIQLGHLCEYCAETLKDDPACSACEKWSKFQWRGAAEE